VSYRGKRKGNYGSNQKRSRFHNPFHRKNRNKNASNQQSDFKRNPNPPTSEIPMQTSPIPVQIPLEVWLKIPTTFSYNGAESKLPTDPAILTLQTQELARIAAKRHCEIQLRIPGNKEPVRRFQILGLDRLTPETLTMYDATTMDPQVAALKAELQAFGYTLLPVEENQENWEYE
jgi:hypothetical protein